MTAVYTATRHFSYKSAAAEFEIPERWLRTHIKTLPHRRIGRYVRFSVADLLAISDRFAATTDPGFAATDAPTAAMPDIQPSSRRRADNR